MKNALLIFNTDGRVESRTLKLLVHGQLAERLNGKIKIASMGHGGTARFTDLTFSSKLWKLFEENKDGDTLVLDIRVQPLENLKHKYNIIIKYDGSPLHCGNEPEYARTFIKSIETVFGKELWARAFPPDGTPAKPISKKDPLSIGIPLISLVLSYKTKGDISKFFRDLKKISLGAANGIISIFK